MGEDVPTVKTKMAGGAEKNTLLLLHGQRQMYEMVSNGSLVMI
jgi:hypothetical protein